MEKKTNLPSSNNNEIKEAELHLVHQELYSGPIPSAMELDRYEKVQPGAADRIIKMAEKQASHRQKIEEMALRSDVKAQIRGQIFGFLIFILTIIIGFILILLNKDVFGIVSILGSLATIIGLFVYNRESIKDDIKKKK